MVRVVNKICPVTVQNFQGVGGWVKKKTVKKERERENEREEKDV